MTYTTIKHPVSGETYAAELREDGQIARLAGPVQWRDIYDEGTLCCLACGEVEATRGAFSRDGEGGQCSACGSRLLDWSQETIADFIDNELDADARADAKWMADELYTYGASD